MCVLILDECLLFGGFNLLTQGGCCGVYLLDPRGVLYRRYIYLVQVRIVDGRFIGSSVSTELRSAYSSSRLRVLSDDHCRLAATFLNR